MNQLVICLMWQKSSCMDLNYSSTRTVFYDYCVEPIVDHVRQTSRQINRGKSSGRQERIVAILFTAHNGQERTE